MRISKNKLLIITFILADIIILSLVAAKILFKPEKVHFHAGFRVYINGQLQDFTDLKYMQVTPCGNVEEKNLSGDELQMAKAHLHDYNGAVVHAHIKGGKWGDLFKNISYDITSLGPVRGYVEGKEVENILQYDIKAYESVIILVGNGTDIKDYLPNAVTKESISEAEKLSETCGAE